MSLFHKDLKEETLIVEDMMCQHCVGRIVDGLKKIKVKAEADLETKQVKVFFDENKIGLPEIKKTIKDLGFTCK